jgi:hypothetical protein
MVFFHPVKSINKQLCQQYRYKLIGMQGSRYLYERAQWKPQKIVVDIFVCVLSGSNVIRRLSLEIPDLHAGTADHSLVCDSRLLIDRLPSSKHPDRQLQVTLHVVESIQRLCNLERELKDRIRK